jgi:glucose-1-phosphate thymidylyltransferase
MQGRVDGAVSADCIVQGTVVVEKGATVVNSTLRGPLIVGARARVENSYIGPFSAVGPGCLVLNSEIEDTIIMERSRVTNLAHRLDASLIGRDVVVGRSETRPRGYKLRLGDHSTAGLI